MENSENWGQGTGKEGDIDQRVYISDGNNVWVLLDLLQTDASNKIIKSIFQISPLQKCWTVTLMDMLTSNYLVILHCIHNS